jgi:hypothetical protein
MEPTDIRFLPGLTSEHEFFSPVDENFERDMEAVFANATRGEIESPTIWPMGSYHALEFYQAKSGVPMLPMDEALNNPNGPWGGIKGWVGPAYGRGLRGLSQDIVQVPPDQLQLRAMSEDTKKGVIAVASIAGSLLLLYVALTAASAAADAYGV